MQSTMKIQMGIGTKASMILIRIRSTLEDSKGYWGKTEYDSNEDTIYYEDSNGFVEDNRPKPCKGAIVKIDGIKYELK